NLSVRLKPPLSANEFRFKSVLGTMPFWSNFVHEKRRVDFSLLEAIETLLENVTPVWKKSLILLGWDTQGVGRMVLPSGALRSPPLYPATSLGESNCGTVKPWSKAGPQLSSTPSAVPAPE